MADVARQRLQYIVECYGDDILNDRAKTSDLIGKLCGEDSRRIELLVGALNTGFVPDLIRWRGQGDPGRFLPRIAKTLERQLLATPEEALWTAGSWAVALGLLGEAEADRLELAEAPPASSKEPSNASVLQPPQRSGFGAHLGLVVRIASLSLVILCLLWPAHCISQIMKKHPPPPTRSDQPLDPAQEKVHFTLERQWPLERDVQSLQFLDAETGLLLLSRAWDCLKWDPASGAAKGKVGLQGGSVVAFSPNGEVYAVAHQPSSIAVLNMSTESLVGSLPWDGGYLAASLISPDGRLLLTGREDRGGFALWDLASMRYLVGSASLTDGASGGPLAFSPDGKSILVRSLDRAGPAVISIRGAQLGVLSHFDGHGQRSEAELGTFNGDGSRVATLGSDRALWIWDAANGRGIVRIPSPADLEQILFHPRLPLLFCRGTDGKVRVWDARSGKEVGRLESAAGAMAISPDGALLAAEGYVTGAGSAEPTRPVMKIYRVNVGDLGP